SDVRTLMNSMKVLRNGEKISIFPEGTRNKLSDEEFLPFHGGAAMLAIKTKTPIIPFVICNRPRVFRKTHVRFGEPMELSEYYDRKLSSEEYEEAEEKLKQRLYELREEHRAYLADKKKKRKK
ncbi:MAG: 1-acyl-sn-glycerol-3-phosphate acyltransferase, partial [Clostridia bacterium]|nr:1-acyl-sn-glycerol-3-phosphate acyltransferase [Clostridia bacterium]